ncbi:Piso0_001477 [Millerozyma farinosa CBS 7064]|uniref:Piso0_001477 protein n=1 Tax=Pichia sorbitophila (strain ATCC MYA-4447 / BCRC 22081 / CBS 7064 / NBRC 10061 / NRRL Y-12695) TaxID=559304 RepID=G8YN98_PICSO|nr:Piso0_001477 [Millerozyma farinosa CBS 7064]
MAGVTSAGLLLSAFLGGVARRLQVSIIGKEYPRSWNRVPGYLYSIGFFTGGYLIFSQIIDNNRKMLDRRLQVLREQRAQEQIFHEFSDEEDDHRFTADKRGGLFRILDKSVQSHK